jgi:hypothetical protein
MRTKGVILTVVIFITISSSAIARELTTPTGEGGWFKNPDNTYTFYQQNHGSLEKVETLSESDFQKVQRVYARVEDELNTTTDSTDPPIAGLTEDELKEAEHETGVLDTDKPYMTRAEYDVAEGFVDDAEADGLTSTVAESVGAASGSVIAGLGAAYVGVELGNAIDRLIEFPELHIPLGSSSLVEPFYRFKAWHWIDEEEIQNIVPCSKINSETETLQANALDECVYVGKTYTYEAEREIEKGEFRTETETHRSVRSFSNSENEPECPTVGVECAVALGPEPGKVHVLYLDLFGPEAPIDGAYPQHSVKSVGHVGSEPLVNPRPHDWKEKYTELSPPSREHLNTRKPTTTLVVRETKKDKLVHPLEEGAEVPDPRYEEIPKPEPNEAASEYYLRLHELGFTNVEVRTLPEVDIDPDVGPEDVASVSPSPGSRVAPDTKIVVEENPGDAPEPGGGGGIGPPTLPGIKLPELHLLCTTMPFGVPCWLIRQLNQFSAAKVAPVWTIGPFEWAGIKIPPATIHLDVLEPIMEVVRPFMLIFGTIGLVLLFYRIFTGKSLGGGENPAGQVPDPEPWNSIPVGESGNISESGGMFPGDIL